MQSQDDEIHSLYFPWRPTNPIVFGVPPDSARP